MRDDHYSTDDHDEDRESDDDSSEMEQESALVPRGLFPKPPKPGKKCTFEVVSVKGDEVELKYSSSKDDDSDDDSDDNDDTVSVASKNEDGYGDPFEGMS